MPRNTAEKEDFGYQAVEGLDGYYSQGGTPYIYNNPWGIVGKAYDGSGTLGAAFAPVDDEHAAIAAKNNIKLSEMGGKKYLDISSPDYKTVYPDQKTDNFLTGVLAPWLASVAIGSSFPAAGAEAAGASGALSASDAALIDAANSGVVTGGSAVAGAGPEIAASGFGGVSGEALQSGLSSTAATDLGFTSPLAPVGGFGGQSAASLHGGFTDTAATDLGYVSPGLPVSQSADTGETVPNDAQVPPPGEPGAAATVADETLGGTSPISPVDVTGAPGDIPTDVSAPGVGAPGVSSGGQAFSSGGGGGLTPFSSTAADVGADYGGDTVLRLPELEKAVGVNNASDSVFGAGGLTAKKAMDLLLKGGPLALGVAGAINAKSAGQKAAADIRQVGAPQKAAGEALVNQFNSGKLSAADSKAIDDWEKQATAQMKQFFANAKISDSTQAVQSLNDIQAKATAMRSQALLNTLNTGLEALGVTDQYQLAAINAELSGDKEATASAMNFLNSYGSWLRALPVLTGEQPTKAA